MSRTRWPLIVACCLVSGSLFAQSLAGVAKKEKQRREKSDKPVEVIDEKDLQKARGSGGIVESTVSTGDEDDEEEFRWSPSVRRAPDNSGSTSRSSSSSSSDCESVRQSLTRARRRVNELVTVTYRVPTRNSATHVRTGIDSRGNPTYSQAQTYETRTKKVSCSTAEGRNEERCQSLAQEVDSLTQELRTCLR